MLGQKNLCALRSAQTSVETLRLLIGLFTAGEDFIWIATRQQLPFFQPNVCQVVYQGTEGRRAFDKFASALHTALVQFSLRVCAQPSEAKGSAVSKLVIPRHTQHLVHCSRIRCSLLELASERLIDSRSVQGSCDMAGVAGT